MTEFELITRYFTRPTRERRGVGDDCALIAPGPQDLALTTDMLIEGRHFFPDAEPGALGHKALAVNLSDLAATGAQPRCFLLSLALPAIDPAWLDAFSRGLLSLADAFGCELIGGDTTRSASACGDGPVTISITAIGSVPGGAALGRGGARPGDELWVSGTLGDAALGLILARARQPAATQGPAGPDLRGESAGRAGQAGQGGTVEEAGHIGPDGTAAEPGLDVFFAAGDADWLLDRLHRPSPRVALGLGLRGLASAALDLSDGLLGDLAHLLERSKVGAIVQVEKLPRSPALARQPSARQLAAMLGGGDDYELLFTAPPAASAAIRAAAAAAGVAVSCIGSITAGHEILLRDAKGNDLDCAQAGWRSYDHFASTAASFPPVASVPRGRA